MKVSAGLILTDGKKILIGKVNKMMHDIPKGGISEGETPFKAMVRELYEETNLIYEKDIQIVNGFFKDLGEMKYIKNKNLHLFIVKTDVLPSVSKMKCNSFHEDKGIKIPEMLEYKYIDFNFIRGYLTESMCKVLEEHVVRYMNV